MNVRMMLSGAAAKIRWRKLKHGNVLYVVKYMETKMKHLIAVMMERMTQNRATENDRQK